MPTTIHRPRTPVRDFCVLLGTLIAIAVVAIALPNDRRVTAWVVILGLMTWFVVFLGYSVTGVWRGAFIDDRNRVSLSRLQLLAWSVVVLSGLLTAALTNLAYGSETPLDIDVPSSLWVVMGISTTSLIGSPAVRANREQNHPNSTVCMDRLQDARWSDLFLGEEHGGESRIDIGKMQMFFFTFILLVTYGAAIAGRLEPGIGFVTAFPPVDEGINVLLGISHTGYLTAKGLQPKPTAPAAVDDVADAGGGDDDS